MDSIYLILIFICGNLCKSVHTEATTKPPHVLSSTIQSSADAKNTEATTKPSHVLSSTIQSSADAKNTEATTKPPHVLSSTIKSSADAKNIEATTKSPHVLSSTIKSSADAKNIEATTKSPHVLSSTIQSSADAKNTEATTKPPHALSLTIQNSADAKNTEATTKPTHVLSSTIQNSADAKNTEATTKPTHVISSTIQSSADAKNTEQTSSVTVSFQITAFNTNIAKIQQIPPFCKAQNDKTESKDTTESWIAALSIGGILIIMLVAIIIIVIWKCTNKPVSVDPNWAGRSPFADGENPVEIAMDDKEPMQAKKRTSLSYIGSLPFMFKKSQYLLDDCGIQDESKENMDEMQSHSIENEICQRNLRTEAENTAKSMNGIHVPPCSPVTIRPNDHSHLTEIVNSLPPPSDPLDLSRTQSPPPNSIHVSNLQDSPTDSFDFSILPPPPDILDSASLTELHETPNLLDQQKRPPSNEPISNTHWSPRNSINELSPMISDLQALSDSELLPHPLCHQDEDQTEILPPPPEF
ncbi:protein EVI2B [Microcaecilia unicolor]|uniref:Protein EVI2B n=1 Tax=Microcaecilia unicolor TaxID=1415580 RepID=A0A6P8A0M9_9AMPH|nr:protein EVI2B [Microcaecilia unicolor]